MIHEKIEEIFLLNGRSIIVLKGIATDLVDSSKKLFSFNIDYLDTVDLNILKKEAFKQLIEKKSLIQDYLWMTIEEFQLIQDFFALIDIPMIVLENNFYDKQFPYEDTLSDVREVYEKLYYQSENELDLTKKKLLENVSFFYGQINYSKQSDNYYVTYPEMDNAIPVVKLYDSKKPTVQFSNDVPSDDVEQIELSDDETPFLDLEAKLLAGTNKKNIIFVLTGSENDLPNHYLERIYLLSKGSQANFFFSALSMRRKVIENQAEYAKMLNQIYGYKNFQEIDFYANIENHSKETVSISQVQIIDDIVSQAEKAMHGEPFRDVYITAATGAGKSVMFQIPALYLSKKYSNDKPLTLVISPLIALMVDQVSDMKKKGITNVATINGNTPPHEKEKIIDDIKEQRVDILYLSPESLQARTDITNLIGDRGIGVVIIDEAHIVTTWGKSFRADYWYLGIYLAKLRKKYKFPIVTFTATAIYGGQEDMYLDTRNSLNMISPISYFGNVKRDDLLMDVRSSEKELDVEGRDYRKTKKALALNHMKKAKKNGQKSLLYFPTVKLLIDFYSFVEQNEPKIADKTGKYYGTLSKEEKDTTLDEFKTGELEFVLATKAFGMGVDISDITNVYHYAPTGSVVDYIQEIGRAARDKEKVPYGFGIIDFLSKDMNDVKKLYGMSAIKKSQILEVMRKVVSVYKEKGNDRNLIMSPEDFKYIFVQNKRDEDSLDNKVKTVLLMIEKDFESPRKIGYSPFVARPRSLYGTDLIFVTPELEKNFINSKLGKYITRYARIESKKYSKIYQVDLGRIWENDFKNMSFPQFKYSLFTQQELEKLKYKDLFKKFRYASGVSVSLSSNTTVQEVSSKYRKVLAAFEDFINQQIMANKQFTVRELGDYFMKSLRIENSFQARAFAQTIINIAFEFTKNRNIPFLVERSNSSASDQRYIVHNSGDIFTEFVMKTISEVLDPKDNFYKDKDVITTYFNRAAENNIDATLAVLGVGEAIKLLNFQLIGGGNPQIYLRMNSIGPLEKAIKQGDFYKNTILEDVKRKHYTSVAMLKYLFNHEQPEKKRSERITHYTQWFWDTIEDYFMGILPQQVKDKLSDGAKK